MSSFAEDWARAGQGEDDFDPPDGAYLATLTDARVWTTDDGRSFAKLIWQLREGENTGRDFEDFGGIDHEVALRIFREKVVMCGLGRPEDIKTIDRLDGAVKALIGVEATIGIKHNVSKKNGQTYLNVDVFSSKTAAEPDAPVDTRGLTNEEEDFADSLGDDDEAGF